MAAETARRMPWADRHAQLLLAAASAFREGGFAGTSMEAVAERAGVTRLIVYRHFESKDGLYREVLQSVTAELRERIEPDQQSEVIPVLVEIAAEQPDAFRLLWRHARHEPEFAADAELFRLVAAEFAQSIIERFIDDPVTLRWGSATLVAYLHDGICNWLDLGDVDDHGAFTERLRAGARAMVVAWASPSSGASTDVDSSG
ncbi:MAG: TetR/AcrR family transcriptional regulator [Ilumatobacter fluminis]|uniref:TetR/AcrR family transcriptional regulator n=1 Tax=Ilumatobacter fluminis TaxID=467091 RepID=UPI0032EC4E4C